MLTFGTKRLSLNLSLRRKFSWNFCIAAVPNPIIGADLLAHYHLVPYLHESRLVDTTTGLGVVGFIKSAAVFSVSSVDRSAAYSEILSEFPQITGISQISKIKVSDVQHHIITKGPPVFERARRLSPDKLLVAKQMFRQMLDDGVCRPSSSPWASPIHMTRKKNGECGYAVISVALMLLPNLTNTLYLICTILQLTFAGR